MVINFIDRWKKSSTPMRYCILFVFFHWVVLYPIALAIDGHPPIFMMIIDCPTVAAISLFNVILPSSTRSLMAGSIVLVEVIIGVITTTISYGLLGYLIGHLFNRRRRKM